MMRPARLMLAFAVLLGLAGFVPATAAPPERPAPVWEIAQQVPEIPEPSALTGSGPAAPQADTTGGPATGAASGQAVSTQAATERPVIWMTTKHPWELYLAAITVSLLVGMTGLLVAIAWRNGLSDEFQKTFLLLTVIFAALFLIVAGYSDRQTAPVFSLLGAIVGYLFGRGSPAPPAATAQGQAGTQPGGEVRTIQPAQAPTASRDSASVAADRSFPQ